MHLPDQCLTEEEKNIINIIAVVTQQESIPCYIIGGWVRDKILKRKSISKDMDIVCVGGDASYIAEQISKKWTKGETHINYFKHFGVAQLTLLFEKDVANRVILEFVTARKESYSYDSRNPQVTPGNLLDDQSRRDLTINTIALSLQATDFLHIYDPFHGIEYIEKKILKTPLADARQTYSDDPLRMIRTIRFAAQLQFDIDPHTLQAIIDMAHRIKIISQERITDEIQKIMMSTIPSIGWKLLDQTHLLSYIFPRLLDLKGAVFIDGKGHKDNFTHTLQVLDNVAIVSNDLWLRWAALLHDIAKPATKKFDKEHGWSFHGHEVVGAKMVPSIFRQFKLPTSEPMLFVKKLVFLHLRPISLTKEDITDSAIRRLLFEAGEHIDQLMILCKADITSKNPKKVIQYLQNFNYVETRMQAVEEKDHLRAWQPPITGSIIMQTFNIPPCKEVGIIKEAIKEAILDGKIENDFEPAYQFMLSLGKELNLLSIN